MKLLVCGGREYGDYEHLSRFLDDVLAERWNHDRLLVIHGDARGADSLAQKWAVLCGHQPVRVPALWDIHGNKAGAIRNSNMLLLGPDIVVAFPGGAGTAHMVRIAKKQGVPVIESPR